MAAASSAARELWLCLLLALIAVSMNTVSAQDATTTAVSGTPPDYMSGYIYGLWLDIPPLNTFKVVPLTSGAGLNDTDTAVDVDLTGDMVAVNSTNVHSLNDSTVITYMSCESDEANSMLNTIMDLEVEGIVLYNLRGYCSLGAANLSYTSIFTMYDHDEAIRIHDLLVQASGTSISGTISESSEDTDGGSNNVQPGGTNSAVAMSILYSITGLITLLFLIIIASGAVRAHRHPERYGPRAGFGGRPRQSRARGLARAVLETIPIVKFGDPHPDKHDPELELHRTSVEVSTEPRPAPPINQNDASGSPKMTGADTSAAAVQTETRSTSGEGLEGQNEGSRSNEEHLGCSICTEDFTVGEDVRVLPCDHKFHPPCIDPWLVNVSGTCPLCRLDLRPQSGENSQTQGASRHHVETHLVEIDSADVDAYQRRRRSRLLDWNRLRHATVDERIQALRHYRQTQQRATNSTSPEEERSHAGLTNRLRERFHIRTRAQPSNH